jgi:hypothetical protein
MPWQTRRRRPLPIDAAHASALPASWPLIATRRAHRRQAAADHFADAAVAAGDERDLPIESKRAVGSHRAIGLTR